MTRNSPHELNLKVEEELVFAKRCINCGLCIAVCPIVKTFGLMEFLGPRSINVSFTRDKTKFAYKNDVVFKCLACNACYEICPKKIPTGEITIYIKSKIIGAQK